MAAFITFVRTFAVWIYLFLIFGILFGIKMLVDAQRLSRTTLFSLDQERAGEQTYRGLGVILVFLLGMFVVTVIILLSPLAPAQDPTTVRGATPTLPAFVFASSTPAPSATFTALPRTETPFATATPIVATATRTVTRPPLTTPQPTLPTPVYALPAPKIVGPVPNGVVVTGFDRARIDLNFQWIWECLPCKLGPDDRFIVTVSYIDRSTGGMRFIGGSAQNNFLTMADILRGYGQEVWHQAKDDAFQWYVQVKRGEQSISPPSETWKFIWR